MILYSEKLLQELLEMTHANIKAVEKLKNEPIDVLNWKEHPESWSALECMEHLNRYGYFYIPEITQRINHSKHKNSEIFKSNWLGKYFSKSVSYQEHLNKMKTFKSMNPLNSKLDRDTIDTFLNQQQQIIELLHKSKDINLDKTKTSISISKLIKLKLGDTFRVLIYHNERHIKQAEKAILKARK
ncbi:DinB family protein [Confluentibacter citreus]|uniref:DinB family protein n=1 Tax=Confluentibacter citreus TaxID=2007307 RepID=UPI000C28E4CA|nr:DinB family protein [Confluentibacter citreus]